jgi:diguanylate cyclase (GGDEF)-like protein
MSAVKSVLRFFAVPDDPELVLAQARALSRQIPLLYAMLLANTFILAATHLHTAPAALTAYVPALLTVISVGRLIFWWRNRNEELSLEKARRSLTGLLPVAAVLATGFTAWSFGLFQYGDAYQRSHVAFYMGITSIGCMFCLMHARGAALIVALCVLGPFTVLFASSGQQTFFAIAVNMVLVLATLIFILLNNNRDFGALVASRTAMVQKQEETQRLSDENYRLANVDSLTGLPNRRSFERQLTEALAWAAANGTQIAVARLDLDSFKSVNDLFGQIAGDEVLIETGRRVNALRRPTTFVARLGSDQFALVLDGANDETSLQVCGDVLTAAMRTSFETKLGTVHLSASAGFALSRPGDTADALYDRADYVTWVAKRDMRGKAVVFTDRHAETLSRVRRMEHALRTANLDSEIYILFQPQFDTAQRRTTGYEVLARWRSPVLGEVSPGEFIPMAERIGMISKITQVVLRKALAVSETLPKSLRLSVNLSAHDVGSTTTVEAIVALVETVGKPCRIDFEITETAVMRDLDQANDALVALLALGSRIALDDFGTGHSSLTHVQKLPLDRIKVDRSFVADVSSDPTSRAIIKTTIDLCRNLGISCVFEGIETEEQLEALLGMGGTVMQGYLFGRPMSLEAMMQHQAENGTDRWARRSRMFNSALG